MLFKERTKENLETTIKQSYWNYVAQGIANTSAYSIDDINEAIKKSRAMADYDFDVKNCSNHKPEIFGLDLSEHLAKINQSLNEKRLLIKIEKDNISSEIIDTGIKGLIGGYYSSKHLYKKILNEESLNVDALYILVHNHPDVIAVHPSDVDIRSALRNEITFSQLGAGLVDYMIVGEYDMYSVLQNDETLPDKEKIFLRSRLSKEEIDNIKETFGYRLSTLAKI